MDSASRVKQVIVIAAIVAALVVSGLAAAFIVKIMTDDGRGSLAPQKNTKQDGLVDNDTAIVGGYCDGCELMYAGMPDKIAATDTSAGWTEPGSKLLVSGTVFKQDGKTPAPGVIIYYWHTDSKGYYSPRDHMDQRALRHGHIRGWIRTDSLGKYALYTIHPGVYPDRSEPEHIHIALKEPELGQEYYIDEFVFKADPLLAPAIARRPREDRGGSGILKVIQQGNLQLAAHDIILGRNIPNYPEAGPQQK